MYTVPTYTSRYRTIEKNIWFYSFDKEIALSTKKARKQFRSAKRPPMRRIA
jgi:hypothetical protein